MSTPKNHHYVSQCQIRNFFNNEEGKIYLYDKTKDNIFSKTTTKTVFSEKELNTIYENGQIDHETIEKDLNDNFENEFNKNLAIIQDYANTQICEPAIIHKALFALTKLGIVGYMRTPESKAATDATLFGGFKEIMQHASPELKASYDSFMGETKGLKYQSTVRYSKIAQQILDKMLPISNIIYVITNDDYFVLPDCSSLIIRERINEYFNPDIKEMADVTIPLTSKIMLQSVSAKTGFKTGGIFYLGNENADLISQLNNRSLSVSTSMIACENLDYLKRFIENAKQDYIKRGIDIRKKYDV